MRYLLLVLALILCSCAPMPGSVLFEGLTEPTPIEEVRIHKTVGWVETSVECSKRIKPHLVFLNCLLNFCVVMGCAEVYWDDTGKVTDCYVWAAADWDWIVDHELKHCEGYKDKLY